MTVEESTSTAKVDFKNQETLRRLYREERLSLKQIAKLAGTTISHIHYYMTKFGIERREWTGIAPKCDPHMILGLYWGQGKTVREVAWSLGLSKSTVQHHLARFAQLRPRSARWLSVDTAQLKKQLTTQEQVPLQLRQEFQERRVIDRIVLQTRLIAQMARRASLDVESLAPVTETQCDPAEIRRLYWEARLSLSQIVQGTGLSRRMIRRALLNFDAPSLLKVDSLRTGRMNHKYWRCPFSGDGIERAYLLGYRAGDMNAFQASTNTVVARVSTTHQAMLEMFEKTFAPYGHCEAAPRQVFLTGYDWQIRATLDKSFSFLIAKPTHPPCETKQFYTFLAGFSDSDCNWSVHDSKGKTHYTFGITSANHELLAEVKIALGKEGYHTLLAITREKGTVKVMRGPKETRQITLTKDTWALVINSKEEVMRLARMILPLSRHREKISRMCLVLDEKNEGWAIMAPKIDALRRDVKADTVKTINRAEIEYKARHARPSSGVVC